MPKTSDEILTGLLSTSYKLDETGVASLKEEDGSWKDDALDHFIQIDQQRVTALKGDVDKQLGERYSRGKREAMEALEKQLRDEFGIKDVDAKGIDLVKHIVQAKAKALETLPEEKVKAHPLYIQLEEQARNFPKTLEEKIREREQSLVAEFKTREQQRAAVAKAKTIFQGMKPILPKNADVAAAQMTLLDNYIAGQKLQFVENEAGELVDIIPMKADGSGRLEDAHGHPVKYEDLVRQGAARYFEFAVGEDKGGAPDPNGTGGESGGGNGGGSGAASAYSPKTEAEYAEAHAKILRTIIDPGERRKELDKLKAAGVRNGVVSA